MARSVRHTPIKGVTTCPSEKFDKRLSHSRLRMATRLFITRVLASIMAGTETDEQAPRMREVSDVWCFGKDSKYYWKDLTKADTRK